MSLYVSPQVIPLVQGGTPVPFVLTSTTGGLGTVTITPAVTNQATFTQVNADPTQQNWTATATADAYATFICTATDSTSGESATFIVSVSPSALVQTSTNTTLGGGYTTLGLINQIRLRANEPNLPVSTDILSLANDGLNEIEEEVGLLKLVGVYPTVASQTVQALSNDIRDIISCSWSTGPVAAQGSLVYPMFPMEQGAFMDNAAGFPAVGFGPPTNYFIYRDQNGVMEMQLYPAAMVGQLNVYYYGRPSPWTLNGGSNGSASNLDPSGQEAVILWTVARVLENRGRAGEAAQIWQPQLERKLEKLVTTAKRRTAPKSGQVRDIYTRGYPNQWWR